MKITATPRKNEELKKANNIHSTQIDETDELRKDYVKGEAEDRSTELKGKMQKLWRPIKPIIHIDYKQQTRAMHRTKWEK